MHCLLKSALPGGILLAALAGVQGASIPGLYATGVDNNGNLLGAGAIDSHYTLVQSADAAAPGPATYIIPEGFPIPPWAANGPNSKWIGPMANQSSGNQAGDYRYRLSFSLAGLDPSTAVITGTWSSDNTGTDILLNGVSTGISNDGNFQQLANTFVLSGGFVDGTNTLDFVVNNAGTAVSPSGLRVELSGTAELLPPPGTPPSIITPPASQGFVPGDRAALTVRATGAPTLSYQWRRNLVSIPGATTSTWSVNSFSEVWVGSYDVVVSNAWGIVTSAPPAQVTLRYPTPAELTYEPTGPSSRKTGLAITEIMYHPAPRLDGRNLEFVEIYNSNPFPEDVGGYLLSMDQTFSIPQGTVLAGLSYLVIAPNPPDVKSVYGITNVIGGFTNNLPNNGGTLQLVKPSGGVVLKVSYDDNPPWSVAADGTGHSLVLAKPSYGENDPQAWARSAFTGGSPGTADPLPVSALDNVVINEFLAHTDPPDQDFIELYNHGGVAVDLSGCVLTDDPATNKFVVPSGTTIGANGFRSFTETELAFALSAAGETLYLKNPDGTRVIDAVRFGGQENGVSMGRFPDGDPEFYRLITKTPGTNNSAILVSPVVINEIMFRPISGDDDDQYLELFNRGSQPVNVAGWRLEEGVSFSFPVGTMIPAGGYLVVARNQGRLLTNYPNLNPVNTLGNFDGRLSHNGERIVLSMPDTIVSTNTSGIVSTNTIHIAVAEVTYATGGRWGQWSDGGGSSLELVDARSNPRVAASWADSDEGNKGPWTTVEWTGLTDYPHPSVPTADQLQIFLLGPGDTVIDNVEVFTAGGANRVSNSTFQTSGITGWTFQGTHRLSMWTNAGFNSTGAMLVRSSARGNQAADRIRVPLTSAITTNQITTIRAKARWVRGWPELLMRLKGGTLENAWRLPVPANLGTPGAVNSRVRANIGPAIVGVTHRPALPRADEPIRVTAQVQDPDGVQSVLLRYRRDPSTTLSAVVMVDDGTNGDRNPRDGIYTGIIPAQPTGSLIAFRIEATDKYQPAGTSVFPTQAPAQECLVRIGETIPSGAFGAYRFWITEANFNFWSNREKLSGENIDVTFVYGTNRVFYNVGARFGGSPYSSPGYTTPTGAPCGYSLDFLPDEPLLGQDGFVLDYLTRDPTGQREQLMFWFLEQFKLPNNYRRYIRLYVNGVARGTIYEDAQRPNNSAVSEWFPDDTEGTLLKTDVWDEFDDGGTRVGSVVLLNSLENLTTTNGIKKVARYRWCWETRALKTTANDYSQLFSLVDAMNAPAPGYWSAVDQLVDFEHWMRTFCMNDLASYWDGFGNPNGKNTYLYKPEQSTWKLMSWDFDVGLGVFNDPVDAALFPALADATMMRLYAQPEFVRPYWCALDEALNTFFRIGAGTPIETFLNNRYAAFQTNGIGLASPDPIKSWISQRRSYLLTQLATVATNFSVLGPTTIVTNRNAILLTGTAPVNVRQITVNDVLWDVTWLNTTTWRLLVPVTNGTTPLVIRGLDRLGQPIASASRTVNVTYTGTEEAPESLLVINEIMFAPRVERAEYVELLNRSAAYSFNLSGWKMNGLDYEFPPGTTITNGQLLVLARDRSAFGAAHGWSIPVAGVFDGGLQSDGETISLLRPGTTNTQMINVTRVRYEAGLPWPAGAVGTGTSFQLMDPAQDNWRVGNWATVPTNGVAAPEPQWVYFSTNGIAGSSLLYLYLQSAGDIYIDDVMMVAGSTPGAGQNLVTNGGFETALAGTWTLSPNFVLSTNANDIRHSGNYSLHLLATAAGTGNGNSIYQTITPGLTSGQTYSLSLWYRQTTNGGPLTVRLSGSGLSSGAIDPAPPVSAVNLAPATPGATNSVRTNFTAFAKLWINEVQPENLTGITNRAGQAVPWIEIVNPTSNAISLAGCYLTDSYTNLTRWNFPANAFVAPGQFKVIFADGRTDLSTADEWHTSFVLPAPSGQLALSRTYNAQVQVLDYFTYGNIRANRSAGSYPDAQSFGRQEFVFPTPRGPNNPAAAGMNVYINEWMADNAGVIADPADNDYEDWFELYNAGTNTVDLGGCLLTDSMTNLALARVPDNGHYVIPPRAFLLVWADGEPKQNSTNRQDLHADFKLDKLGDGIYLLNSDGTLIDSVTFTAQTTDVSQGRHPDGGTSIAPTASPTPGRANLMPNHPPTLTPVGPQFAHLGQVLQIGLLATDPEGPSQQLWYSLEPGGATGATVSGPSGLFNWTVGGVAPYSTNFFTVRVTDSGVPPLSDVTSFAVIVLPLPQLEARPVNNLIRLSFQSLPGRSYQVQYKNALEDPGWLGLSTVIQGNGAAWEVDDDMAAHPSRFYRIVILN